MAKIKLVDSQNWFRRRAETDLMGNPIRRCFNEIQSSDGVVILVWDGANGNELRRSIYPGYKAKRQKAPEDIYKSMLWFRDELAPYSKAISVKVDGYEGDDIVAAIAKKYAGADIFIESSDKDFCQLGLPIARDKPAPESPELMTLYKTMVGDPSDNIPGCKGFGQGGWDKLTLEQKLMLKDVLLNGIDLPESDVWEKFDGIFSSRVRNWFFSRENRETLMMYYKIIEFIPVPWSIIEKNMTSGKNDPAEADRRMKQFMV